jgi:serine/threonine-protein kinase
MGILRVVWPISLPKSVPDFCRVELHDIAASLIYNSGRMSLAPGSRLGAYEIVAPIGAGGMGEVYRAHDAKLRREVALKVLPEPFASDPDRLARFEREARAVAALSHPNILAIHHFGHDGDVTYAVMELLEGQTLRDALRHGALPRRKALDYARQIASALDATHTRGIVHRDLKPDNVFVTAGGHIKVLDFGLVKAAATGTSGATDTSGAMLAQGAVSFPRATGAIDSLNSATVTAATLGGAILGTPGYMSPEQVRGEALDHRSDIFAFGCVLYEMLSAQRAFDGESSIDALHATLRSEPRDLSTLADLPLSIVRLVERCLEKDPAERMQSARDLVFALDTMTADPAAGSEQNPQVAASTNRAPTSRSTRTLAVFAAWGAIAVVGTSIGWIALREPAAPASHPQSAPRGIAVLPFENLGGPDQAYFAAGVTEEVTLQIAKISALRVMSRPAVARFKDPIAELPAMARELGIGAVLAGSVRHDDDRVRVGVQLLAAPSGETLWSEQYDGDVKNVLDVQSTVALRVARALQASLAPEERARIERIPTSNAEAYELYLRSRTLPLDVDESNNEGIALLKRAVELDPTFALGYAMLSSRYTFPGRKQREYLERGVAAARTALDIDPDLARAHFYLGVNLRWLGRMDEARVAYQRATMLDPSSVGAMSSLSILEQSLGNLDQALYWAKRGFMHAPNYANSFYWLANSLVLLDNDVGERFLRAAATRFPPATPGGGIRLQLLLAVAEWRKGDTQAALDRQRKMVSDFPQNSEANGTFTDMAVYLDAPEAAERLDREIKGGRGAGHAMYSPYTPRTWRAHLYMKAGNLARAQPLIEAALAATREAKAAGDLSYNPPMEEAVLFLMLGKRVEALDALDAGVRAGWKDALHLRRDPLLVDLRDDARFVALVQQVEREVGAMRARADFASLDEWAGVPVVGR